MKFQDKALTVSKGSNAATDADSDHRVSRDVRQPDRLVPDARSNLLGRKLASSGKAAEEEKSHTR